MTCTSRASSMLSCSISTRNLSLFDIYLIRKADIRYIVVDDRLAQGLPLYGVYIAAGEPADTAHVGPTRQIQSATHSVKRIYDNGTIQVYDVSGLLAPSHRATPAGTPVGGSGLNVGISYSPAVSPCCGRCDCASSGRNRDTAHLIFCGLTCALLLGVFGAFLIRLLHAPPETVATVVLLLLLALSLRPPVEPAQLGRVPRHPRGTCLRGADNSSRFERVPLEANRILLGCVGVALFLVGAALATLPTLKDWTPPPRALHRPEHEGPLCRPGTAGFGRSRAGEARDHRSWEQGGVAHQPRQDHRGSEGRSSRRPPPQRVPGGAVGTGTRRAMDQRMGRDEPPPTAGSSVRF